MWCPYARASLHAPSSLQMCDLSLMSYFFLLFSVLLFCWGGVFIFYIHHFNGPAPMTKNMIKPLKAPNI